MYACKPSSSLINLVLIYMLCNAMQETGLIPGEERLSNLPDDLVLNILERLDTPDAMRACILSKKMKASLPDMLSRIVVDVDSFAPKHQWALSLRDKVRMNGAVADLTNSILEFRTPNIPLRQLTLRFYLRYYDCISIAKTVAHAMATQKLDGAVEFEILTEKEPCDCTLHDLVYFASQFHTFFTAYPAVFGGLTRLQLENLWFGSESDIPSILLTCKKQQFLRLFNCKSVTRSVLQVEHHHLVELEISYGNFETVELVFVPKLQRMQCQDWISYQEPLVFGYTPLLSSLSLIDAGLSWKTNLRLSQFLANVPSIHQLNLNFQSEKIWIQPESPKRVASVLRELRHVTLVDLPEGCDMAWTMFILEAAPRLKKLSIRVWDHWCKMVTDKTIREENGYCDKANVEWQSSVSKLKHQNLSKLTILGFQPDENFVGYMRRVMEIAVNLKEISLYDRTVRKCCASLDPKIKINMKVVPSRYPQTIREKELLKKQITEGLGVAFSDAIHFRS